ncbi:MAG TPA: molybdenum cofactor guanylyltransferase [Sphingomonas sp.]|nr:molybdenum cofactor guanylyltransferase [Sphingomonas sp.]
MRLLGAIIAGGASRRFGSDKALVQVEGCSLLAHACAALEPQVDELTLCGRVAPGLRCLSDRPRPGLGPLGGLAAALSVACARGFDAVVTVPVDVFPLPEDLVARLGGKGPAVFATQYLIGVWPSGLAPRLDLHLAAGHRSLRSWMEAADARRVDDAELGLFNINRREDLNRAVAA